MNSYWRGGARGEVITVPAFLLGVPLTDREWAREDHLAKKKHEGRPQSDRQKEDDHAQQISFIRWGRPFRSELPLSLLVAGAMDTVLPCGIRHIVFFGIGAAKSLPAKSECA